MTFRFKYIERKDILWNGNVNYVIENLKQDKL